MEGVISQPRPSMNGRQETIKPPEIRDLQHTGKFLKTLKNSKKIRKFQKKLLSVNLVKLANQRLRIMDKKRDESASQLEKLVSVVRKQLSQSIAKILADHFKLESSYLATAVSFVSSPIQGCFRGDFDNDKLVEVNFFTFIFLTFFNFFKSWTFLKGLKKNSNRNTRGKCWAFFTLRDGHILIGSKVALRHAFGISDPLLGRNEAERLMLRTIYDIHCSHEKVVFENLTEFENSFQKI